MGRPVTYATYDDYVARTHDLRSPESQVESMLEDLSAELRVECDIPDNARLKGDAAIVARKLVVDAARKALVPPSLEGFEDTDLANATQASFTANGFTKSVSLGTHTGSAWFDSSSLARLRRLVGRKQRFGYIWPSGGCA